MKTAVVLVLLSGLAARAHQGYFEPSRLRQGNWEVSVLNGGTNPSWSAYLPNGAPPNEFSLLAQPAEDWSFANPFEYYKELRSYSGDVRPTKASFLETRFAECEDYDAAMYDMTSFTEDQALIGYALAAACESLENFFPTVAFVGPKTALGYMGPPSAEATKTAIFQDADDTIPKWIADALPEGYGIVAVEHSELADGEKRDVFCEPFAPSRLFLPQGYSVACIDAFADPTCDNTNVLLMTVEPGAVYYGIWYYNPQNPNHKAARRGRRHARQHMGMMSSSEESESDSEDNSCRGHWKKWPRPEATFITGTTEDFELAAVTAPPPFPPGVRQGSADHNDDVCVAENFPIFGPFAYTYCGPDFQDSIVRNVGSARGRALGECADAYGGDYECIGEAITR